MYRQKTTVYYVCEMSVNFCFSLRIKLKLLNNIEQPVAGVKRQEANREHHSGVLVDDVDVLDLGYGRLKHRSATTDCVEHARSAVSA